MYFLAKIQEKNLPMKRKIISEVYTEIISCSATMIYRGLTKGIFE
jgi:hypothetical protein